MSAAVTRLVGTRPPAAGQPARAARSTAGGPLLPLPLARGVALLALAVFGALHWMAMLDPPEARRAWYAVGAGTLGALALLGAGRLRAPAARTGAAAATAVALLGIAFLAGGVADETLRPDRCGTLATGIGRGLSAVPGARVPYAGLDEWIRLDLALGGTVLVAVAALLAFWPRRSQTGFPVAALVLLVMLYAVPAVALDFNAEFLRGALLALLLLAALRLERLRLHEARGAALLAVAAVTLGLLVAPALDGDTPWWDYETWALSTASARSTSFSWDHRYGPLNWPRDGREMLRVKARQPAYWKAQNLDAFDGRRWRQVGGTREAVNRELPGDPRNLRRWTQTIEVTLRNLRSLTFVTAGIPIAGPQIAGRVALPGPPGIWVSSHTLHRGDSYKVKVYTPRPTEHELAAAGTVYERDLLPYRALDVVSPAPGRGLARVVFPEWDAVGAPVQANAEDAMPGSRVTPVDGSRMLQRTNLRRSWALSRRLKRRSGSPFAYVKAVEAYLGPGFTYSESPPVSAETLDGFLFDAKSGYCQQYSGAMAMLLRMGGVPARVATGFTSGSYDRRAGEYVVRDLDAHSWVEAWFPGIGWVTFDPTPSAAPPRSQSAEAGAATSGDAPDLGGARRLDARAGTGASASTPWERIALLGLLAAALLAGLAAAVVWWRRQTALPPMLELERALRRTRRVPAPGATLTRIESGLARSPEAAGYVRALREQRYGSGGAAPTRSQRRGLRAELARGAGLAGRLRAWWALPPTRPRRRPTLDAHG